MNKKPFTDKQFANLLCVAAKDYKRLLVCHSIQETTFHKYRDAYVNCINGLSENYTGMVFKRLVLLWLMNKNLAKLKSLRVISDLQLCEGTATLN